MKKNINVGLFISACAVSGSVYAGGALSITKKSEEAELDNQLFQAISYGNEGLVRSLLERGADKNARNELGETPLHQAIGFGNDNIVSLLINAGADLNTKTTYRGETPLHRAIGFGSDNIVSLLINAGADLNSKDYDGGTPLYKAALWGEGDVVNTLLRHGANPTIQNVYGRTPLDETYTPAIRQLLQEAMDIQMLSGPSTG